MSKKIHINIDSILRDKNENKLMVRGWCLNLEEKVVPSIEIKANDNIGTETITMEFRPDVNQKYNLHGDEKCGFFILLSPKTWRGEVFFDFAIDNATREISIDLKKSYRSFSPVGHTQRSILSKARRGLGYLKRNGLRQTLQRLRIEQEKQVFPYDTWISANEQEDIPAIEAEIESFAYKPLISVIIPVYNVEKRWLDECLDSIRQQYYPNWEVCLADDCSTEEYVRPYLTQLASADERIKVVFREKNGHISEASNSAIEIATGEFVALVDNDDLLPPNALYEVVKALNIAPELDLFYSDEDKIDTKNNRSDPAFKPNWSPDLLLGTNYISHLGVYRKSIADEIGGFRKGYEGAQDYDLVLRFTEKTDRIYHIPKVLYHWRMLETSTAVNQDSKLYAFEAGKKALEDALVRRGIKGKVHHAAGWGLYDVEYEIIDREKVSIIIPTRDRYEDLQQCIDSIINLSTYENYEIIVADNGSVESETLALFEKYTREHPDLVRILPIDIPFNYSRINNLAAKEARGKYLLFLNNDTKVISPDWLEKMVSFAQFERIGAVGAKLYYPDNTIQHAGVILGLGGAAGHGFHTFPRGDFGYFGRLEINVNYSAVTAACLMVKCDDFFAVDGFDEELRVAFNDVDLCLKLLKLGKNNLWAHGVELFHYESKSRGHENTPEKQERFMEETKEMYTRWGELIENDPYYSPNLTRNGGNYSLRFIPR